MKGYEKCKNDTTNSYVNKYVAMRVVCSCIKKNNLTRCISYLVINDFKNIRARVRITQLNYTVISRLLAKFKLSYNREKKAKAAKWRMGVLVVRRSSCSS